MRGWQKAVAVLFVTATTTAAAVVSASGASAQTPDEGFVRVVLQTPEGVPALAELDRRTGGQPETQIEAVATKAPDDTSAAVLLRLSAGAYQVGLPPVVFDGVRYVGTSTRPEVVVRPGQTAELGVTYRPEGGATDFHATEVGIDRIALTWRAPEGARFDVRRTGGDVPAATRNQGVAVPVIANTASDQGLRPGTPYSYALFTQSAGRWTGPLPVATSTTVQPASVPPGEPVPATYVAKGETLLAEPSDLVLAEPTGAGVRVVLADGVRTPLPGAAVVLPISPSLEGGYLGVVAAISQNGRELALTAGALDDAFVLHVIAIDDFTVSVAGDGEPESQQGAAAKSSPSFGAQAVPKACQGGGADSSLTFSPSLGLGGHFRSTLDTFGIFGKEIPVGATVDVGLIATVTGAAAVRAQGFVRCELPLPKLLRPLTVTPVPISILLEPVAEVTLGGGLEISNVGLTASAGVYAKGTLSLKSGASFSGGFDADASPLPPKVTVNGEVRLKVGGELVLGPGAGTKDAGVIAGVGGALYPIDGAFEPVFPVGDKRFDGCVEIRAGFGRELNLTAKAWLGSFDVTKTVTIEAFKGFTPYFTPVRFGNSCDDTASTPPDSLFGSGVDKGEEQTVGDPDQTGYVEGFVPGARTWVLSTGRVGDAVGVPSQFASTGLGRTGDADLTAQSGQQTFDAVSYQVSVTPSGRTLNVRYVFASEEYPEFVNSRFNDAMAVFIGGQNCARVPGTQEAVSINTINQFRNSALYVDNSQGASGYGTSMDGLTRPLTCSVPVTPGVPVTVRIVVADASDSAYDSAVALVDGGIFSE